MSFYCPNCNAEQEVSHLWAGMKVQCPVCVKEITFAYRNGQSIASTGYAITFKDFHYLVQYKGYADDVHPVIRRLLDCDVVAFEERYLLRRKGKYIPLEVAHCLIQLDPVKQREIYNVAMTMWHG